jgi:hypothetical protein
MLIKVVQTFDGEEKTTWIGGITTFTVSRNAWTSTFSVQYQIGHPASKATVLDNVTYVYSENDGEVLQVWKASENEWKASENE